MRTPLLCIQLELMNEEKTGFYKQVNRLIASLKVIEESNKKTQGSDEYD